MTQVITTVRASLRLAWDASPSTLTQTAAFATVAALLPAAIVWFGKRLVDLAVAGAGKTHPNAGHLTATVLALGLGAALLKAVTSIQTRRVAYFSSVVEFHAEQQLVERIATVDYGYFDRPEWYDVAARATRDLEWRPYAVTQNLVSLFGSTIAVGAMVALLLTLSPALALLGFFAVVPSAAVGRSINRRWYSFWRATTTEERERHYLRDLLIAPEAAKEIRAFGVAEHLCKRHHLVGTRRLGDMRNVFRYSEKWMVLAATVSGASLAVAYGLVARRASRGQVTPGDLTIVIGALTAATAQAGSLLSSLFDLDQNARFLNDYFSFLALPSLLPVSNPPMPLGPLVEGIQFRKVSFTYPGQPSPAIRNITFHLRPGDLLAVVGPNGAGKTTILRLLLRLDDPSMGEIMVGGVDIRQADPAELRARIGLIFQDFFHYDLTVRENLAMARITQDQDEAKIWDALASADAMDIVTRLPRGLDSHVGKRFDDGHDLSGGEWQRLALARLFLRNADIWVLDEPASALDPETEARIVERLRGEMAGRIGIIISHRISAVRIATHIAVLEAGQILEFGSHDELMSANGTYARLVELQSSPYQ